MDNDLLIYFGDSIKALDDGRIGGYLITFNTKDLTDDYFVPECYFGTKDADGRDVIFDHGIPLKAGLEGFADHIFAPMKTRKDDLGVWAETVMNLSDDYEKMVYEMAKAGRLGWSSGSSPHLVKRAADGKITRWIISEGSLTPRPCEPNNRITTLKSYIAENVAVAPDVPAETDAPVEPAAVKATNAIDPVVTPDAPVKAVAAPVVPITPDPIPSPAPLKGLFEREMAERQMSVWDLWNILQSVFTEIAKAASSADVTGVMVDVPSLVTSAVSSFLARLVPAVTMQIQDYVERDSDDPFYVKGFELAHLQSFLANSSAVSREPFANHSELMVSVSEEFAQEVGAFVESLKAYSERAKDKAKFRAETKSGRMLSGANIDRMGLACEKIKVAMAHLDGVHGDLSGLIDAAKPKAEAVELPGQMVGQKAVGEMGEGEANKPAASATRRLSLRRELLRTQARTMGIDSLAAA